MQKRKIIIIVKDKISMEKLIIGKFSIDLFLTVTTITVFVSSAIRTKP